MSEIEKLKKKWEDAKAKVRAADRTDYKLMEQLIKERDMAAKQYRAAKQQAEDASEKKEEKFLQEEKLQVAKDRERSLLAKRGAERGAKAFNAEQKMKFNRYQQKAKQKDWKLYPSIEEWEAAGSPMKDA